MCEYLVGDIACKSGKCNVLQFVVDLDYRERLVDVMPTALCRMVVKHNANKQDKLELAVHSGCDVTTHNNQTLNCTTTSESKRLENTSNTI